jgi:hypothetical protein
MSNRQPYDKSEALSTSITNHIKELAKATDAAHLSEQMQTYLEMCARFHQYSPNNIWLITTAFPDATMVAGYRKWQEMGRYVIRGERGIPILAPMLKKKENGRDKQERVLTGFRVVYVFDISQTDGEPLPEPPQWKSPEQNEKLTKRLLAFAEGQGIKVEVRELEGETQGISQGGSIVLSPEAGTKTLLHEIAHELMHQKGEGPLSRGLRELEAEAVAYVVAKHFDLDKLASPNYVALHGADSESILAHMERIRSVATMIISCVENIVAD